VQRLRRDTARELALDLLDDDGAPIVDATSATLAITGVAGAAIAGSPFTATGLAEGELRVALSPTNTATLGVFDLLWTIARPGGTELRRGQVEIVGAFLYEIGELRAVYDDYSDAAKWPAERLRQNRDAVEDTFEPWLSPQPRRRRRRVTLDGGGISARVLELPDIYPQRPASITVDGVALTTPELDALAVYETGHVVRTNPWPCGRQNIVVDYEHGLAQVPQDLHDAALLVAKATLTTAATPDRATSISTDTGSFRLTIAGKDGPTGFPTVDAALDRWGGGNQLYAV
jgi:hypothetical protein